MKIGTVKKQPNERRRYGISYREALDPGDLIESVVAVVEPPGMVGVATTDLEHHVRVSCDGGDDGVTYKITLTVTTTNGNEVIEDEFYVKVKEL